MANIIENMFRGGGFMLKDDRCSGGALVEDDITGCGHCHGVLTKRERSKNGEPWKGRLLTHAHCQRCDRDICPACGLDTEKHGCVPHDRMIDEALSDNYRREQNAKIMGI